MRVRVRVRVSRLLTKLEVLGMALQGVDANSSCSVKPYKVEKVDMNAKLSLTCALLVF